MQNYSYTEVPIKFEAEEAPTNKRNTSGESVPSEEFKKRLIL